MDDSNQDNAQPRGKSVKSISKFRRILPQVSATIIGNIHQINVGFSSAIGPLIISALIISNHNENETLSMSIAEASWMGSLQYAILPFASFTSGFLSDAFGRKIVMLLLIFPFSMGWFILYQASAVWQTFVGVGLLSLSVGLLRTPLINYVTEISEPSVRGVLNGFLNTSASIGLLLAFLLNLIIPWRQIALIAMIPAFLSLLIFFIPESPRWLLSKNRTTKAENSLSCLRGWASSEAVAEEFNSLQRNNDRSKSCQLCIKQDVQCKHPPPTLAERFAELKRKSILKPLAIVMPMFIMGTQFSGYQAMEPFLAQIFRAYESPISAEKAAASMRAIEIVGNLTLISMIRFTGKRRLYLSVGFGVFLSSLATSCYGFLYLPKGFNSVNSHTESFHLENPNLAYIPTISLFLWCFFSRCGLMSMPWLLISEIFPFKARGLLMSLISPINFGLGFMSKKTYFDLERTLSLPGVSLFYCIITGVGLIYMYFVLPETEGRTLEDIELHFSDNSKNLTDHKIEKPKNRDQQTSNICMVLEIEEKKSQQNQPEIVIK